jgi:hypothetical protein
MEHAEELFNNIITEGETAIDEFIITRKSEELFLDFKRSANNGDSTRLHPNDRNNLAKAVSGFGNSAGGVIVWGVDCSQDDAGEDVARYKVPIVNPPRFTSWLQNAISSLTIPPHKGIRCEFVLNGENQDRGFVVTFIPKSDNAPHQVIDKKQYFIRVGSSFIPTPHDVLAGMFGRRPQPKIIQQYATIPARNHNEIIFLEIGILLKNNGRTVLNTPFLTGIIWEGIGDNCKIEYEPINSDRWNKDFMFGRHISLIASNDLSLPPESWVQPLVFKIQILPPFNANFRFEGNVGCEGTSSTSFSILSQRENMETLYNEYFQLVREQRISNDYKANFTARFFQIEFPE